MPCNCDHMHPNEWERELSRVLMLLDEHSTCVPVDYKSQAWAGYHKAAYCAGDLKPRLDSATAELCARLSSVKDIRGYSPEMQMWWREHQEADAAKRFRENPTA